MTTQRSPQNESLPLLDDGDWAVTISQGQPTSSAQIKIIASRLAAHINNDHVINLCENRYYFLLTWMTACLRGATILLPPNRTRGAIESLTTQYPKNQIIEDSTVAAWLLNSDNGTVVDHTLCWNIPSDRIVAYVFTSGTTGIPQAHAKTWGCVRHNAQLAINGVLGGVGVHIVATVPAQHVYGLETSLLPGLLGCSICADKPFFPGDVAAALNAIPEPRCLVTTPTHLRALLESKVKLPSLRRIVSATAPLSIELARQAEAAWQTELFEIYGCTEAGVMARRRSSQGELWETFPGGQIKLGSDDSMQYCAPQHDAPIVLQDMLEPVDSFPTTHFYLQGRSADMIKVAGKRASLQELTLLLTRIDGVQDAVVFMPQANAQQESRPAAVLVATRPARAILQDLSERIDAVFLPRPLVLVDKLPRNEMGKLPQAELLKILAGAAQSTRSFEGEHEVEFGIAVDHPCIPGHFPGYPIVPAVVMLDYLVTAISERNARPLQLMAITSSKFLRAVLPGEVVNATVRVASETSTTKVKQWRTRVVARCGNEPALECNLLLQELQP